MAVKNYSPELLKVFEAGAKKPFHFDCGSHEKAKALRWRLHALRREMRKEHHWLTSVAEGVIITVRKNSPILIAQPPDLDIEESLVKALEEQAPEVISQHEKATSFKIVKTAEDTVKDYLHPKKEEKKE